MKKVTLLLMALLCLKLAAQDPEFTQFYANPNYLNPAMAGTSGCPRLNMNYRNQWASLTGAYVTNSVAYDQYAPALHGGVSFMVTNDMSGGNTLNWTTVNLGYAYHLELTHNLSVAIGAQATWNQKFLDWYKLTFGDQIDPIRGFVYQTGDLPSGNFINDNSWWTTKGFFDVSSGIVLYSDKFYAGFAAKHLNEPEQSMTLRTEGNSFLSRRFTGHVGATIPLGEESQFVNNTSISPNIIYTYQGKFRQLNMGLYITHSVITAGLWWRTGDAFIMSFGVDAGTFKLGYSYDLTISSLTNASGGSHELSLGFNFGCKEKTNPFRTLSCPSF